MRLLCASGILGIQTPANCLKQLCRRKGLLYEVNPFLQMSLLAYQLSTVTGGVNNLEFWLILAELLGKVPSSHAVGHDNVGYKSAILSGCCLQIFSAAKPLAASSTW